MSVPERSQKAWSTGISLVGCKSEGERGQNDDYR